GAAVQPHDDPLAAAADRPNPASHEGPRPGGAPRPAQRPPPGPDPRDRAAGQARPQVAHDRLDFRQPGQRTPPGEGRRPRGLDYPPRTGRGTTAVRPPAPLDRPPGPVYAGASLFPALTPARGRHAGAPRPPARRPGALRRLRRPLRPRDAHGGAAAA